MKSNDAAFTRHLPVICREWTITVTILRLLLEILKEWMNGDGKRGGVELLPKLYGIHPVKNESIYYT
jgi:hypothetical protein